MSVSGSLLWPSTLDTAVEPLNMRTGLLFEAFQQGKGFFIPFPRLKNSARTLWHPNSSFQRLIAVIKSSNHWPGTNTWHLICSHVKQFPWSIFLLPFNCVQFFSELKRVDYFRVVICVFFMSWYHFIIFNKVPLGHCSLMQQTKTLEKS